MGKKILFILTNVDTVPADQSPTGHFLCEFAIPYKILLDGGFTDITVITPKGGLSPVDPKSTKPPFIADPIVEWYTNDAGMKEIVENTKSAEGINGSDYAAVVYPGGHGPMFDLAHDQATANIAQDCYNNGGIVAAICHGPAGLIPVKLPNGDSIVKGKKMCSFTNEEEEKINLVKVMPFLLEDKFKEFGADFFGEEVFKENVQVDGRLITGQNPASCHKFGQAILAQLKA